MYLAKRRIKFKVVPGVYGDPPWDLEYAEPIELRDGEMLQTVYNDEEYPIKTYLWYAAPPMPWPLVMLATSFGFGWVIGTGIYHGIF